MSDSKYLVLKLEGDFQSYGLSDSKYYRRGTDTHPSKSAIVGLILSALGDYNPNAETIDLLTKPYSMTVFCYKKKGARIETDFQMMGAAHDGPGWDKMFCLVDSSGKKAVSPSKISKRDYLVGNIFKVILKLDDAVFAEQVANSLKDPKGFLYLGRKAFLPSSPIFCSLCNSLKEAEDLKVTDLKLCFTVFDGSYPEKGSPQFVEDVPAPKTYLPKTYLGRYTTKSKVLSIET